MDSAAGGRYIAVHFALVVAQLFLVLLVKSLAAYRPLVIASVFSTLGIQGLIWCVRPTQRPQLLRTCRLTTRNDVVLRPGPRAQGREQSRAAGRARAAYGRAGRAGLVAVQR